jgi:hypothetical protein
LSGIIQTGAAGGLLQLRFKTEVANSKIIRPRRLMRLAAEDGA